MDFPYHLQVGATVVSGLDEFKQTIQVLFENNIRLFLQSSSVGSRVDIHTQANVMIDEAVRETVAEIPSTEIVDLQIADSERQGKRLDVFLSVRYKNDIVNFTFSV